MDRRRFLKSGLPMAAFPLLSHKLNAATLSALSPFGGLEATAQSDNIVVIIRLDGGNDGLNTVIPLDQYDNLAKARANILIPGAKVLKLNDKTGLHPAMTGMQNLFKDGKLSIIQNVGYPSHNQSHFRSTDIWFTGSDYNQILNTGWLGRYLDQKYPGYPNGYPNANFPDPPSIQIGSVLSTLLQGSVAPNGMTITNPNSFYTLVSGNVDAAPATPAGHELTFVRRMIDQTQQYATTIKTAAGKVVNKSTLYDDKNSLSKQLKIVANLIGGGLKTKVYVVSMGGFDTHSAQVDEADITLGKHAQLLGYLSSAIEAFMDDLKLLGVNDRVLGLTISEFGRRIQSNASFGTDHGTSAPHFVFGNNAIGGIIGSSPVIKPTITVNDNVAMQNDYRSIYSTILKDWLGADTALLQQTLLKDFPTLPIIGPAGIHKADKGLPDFTLEQNFPNPARGYTSIRYAVPHNSQVTLQIFDLRGQLIQTLFQGPQEAGIKTYSLDVTKFNPGRYVYRLQLNDKVMQRSMDIVN